MTRKLREFLILLDNESLLYLPGSFLSGKVVIELEVDTPVVGLYFHITGEGVVRFINRGQGQVSDKENYVDFSMRLLGEGPSGPGARVITLPPGVHSFPFKLGLPLGLPSTFLGKHGWVQYFCKASLKESTGIVHKNQQVFIIMNPIDLNLEPSILVQPFLCEIEDTIGVPCLSAGPVSCRVRLDRGGYVPGECICISATIENSSKITIRKTRAILSETIQYTSKRKIVQTETRELASLEKGRVEAGSTDQWRNEMMCIPPLPPTNLRGCHLIRVQYDIYFIITPKGPEKEIKLQLPIMIATYPIRNSDGTLSRKKGTNYPTVLPMFRSWLNTGTMNK